MPLTSRVLKSSILIDEDNARMHLQHVGIDRVRSWIHFYSVVHTILRDNFGRNMKAEYNFYGALPQKIWKSCIAQGIDFFKNSNMME